jgi:Putative addiction module component
MATKAQELRRDALALSDVERAQLAAELLVSLEPAADDDPTVVLSLWGTEIERRARRVLAGASEGQDWKIVRQRVADTLDK